MCDSSDPAKITFPTTLNQGYIDGTFLLVVCEIAFDPWHLMMEMIAPNGTILVVGFKVVRLTFHVQRSDQGVYICKIRKTSTITFTSNITFSLNVYSEFIDK